MLTAYQTIKPVAKNFASYGLFSLLHDLMIAQLSFSLDISLLLNVIKEFGWVDTCVTSSATPFCHLPLSILPPHG